jgi:Mn2+/Fe2+ NRAMP family transporter
VPHLGSGDTLSLTVGIIGATVMPHVVYLHSALQKNRVKAAGKQERRTLLTWHRRDCVLGLGIAGLINMAMLCIAAMASGLSSSSVGTYAGQIVMAAFVGWRIPLMARRALTPPITGRTSSYAAASEAAAGTTTTLRRSVACGSRDRCPAASRRLSPDRRTDR